MATGVSSSELLEAELSGTSYRFKRHLAAGAMGEVAVVEHIGLTEDRVMKILKAHLSGEEEIATRLRTEARILTRLQHENLVRVLDFGFTSAGRPFLVTELLRGLTLKQKLGPRGYLDEREALNFARQMLSGLVPVHEQGIVHRDLKPDNLFVLDGPAPQRIKILDFGVAKVLSAQDRATFGQIKPTAEGMLLGTPLFVSPEQAMGQSVDIRADLYAAGAVLYRMLAGQPVFVRRDLVSLLKAHALEEPLSPSATTGRHFMPATEAVVMRALEKRPDARFQTATEMLRAIEIALEGRATEKLVRPPALPPSPQLTPDLAIRRG